MEAIAALSLAVNVIQVITWGQKVISICDDVSKSGELYPLQRTAVANFTGATASLQKAMSSQAQPLDADEQNLLNVARLCDFAASKLLKELGPANDTNKLKLAFRALRKSSLIKKLDEELATYQRALETQLLLDMRKTIDFTALRLDQGFDKLDRNVQNLIFKLEDGKVQPSQLMDTYHSEILTKLKWQYEEVLTRLDTIQLGHETERLRRTAAHHRALLASLFFPQLSSREEQVPATYPDTYKWALESPKLLEGKNSNLLRWLETGDGLFWISGLAGSGKSTLMKYIIQQERTRIALKLWSGSAEAYLATYFFWSQGIKLQKLQKGLLQTVLYQILSEQPTLTDFCGLDFDVGLHEWTKSRLLQTLYAILNQSQVPSKICLFVDGLDESADDPTELIQLLRQLSSNANLKCVISSRPWMVFHNMLKPCPQLRLQELTTLDIRKFVYGTLSELPCHATFTEGQKEVLIKSLIDKAEGVFLWVSLATASVADGLMNGDEYDELQTRVEELPPRLNDLYRSILNRIENRYQIYATRIFKLLLLDAAAEYFAFWPNVLLMSLVDIGLQSHTQPFSSLADKEPDAVLRNCNKAYSQLQQRCGGLLHFSFKDRDRKPEKFPENLQSLYDAETMQVQFLHKTVFDFFRESSHVLEIRPNEFCADWDPKVARAAAMIRRIGIQTIVQYDTSPGRGVFRSNVSYIAQALLVVRCVELSTGIAQEALLAQLDSQCELLFHIVGPLWGFSPDARWYSLLSPCYESGSYEACAQIGSGHATSLLELSAMAGLVPTVKSKLSRLSPEQSTALLSCTLDGLTHITFSHRQTHHCKWRALYNRQYLLPLLAGLGKHFRLEDFMSRVSLILALLETGAEPNARIPCVVPSLKTEANSSIVHTITELSLLGSTAWQHLLRILTLCPVTTNDYWMHSIDTFAAWADLTHAFIKKGANTQEPLRNMRYIIKFEIDGSAEICRQHEGFCLTFELDIEPLLIVKNYFQSNEHGRAIINLMNERNGPGRAHIKGVSLKAPTKFRKILDVVFDLEDPAMVASGKHWVVSNGALDDLTPDILRVHYPAWERQIRGFMETHVNPATPPITSAWPPQYRVDFWGVALQERPAPPYFDALRKILLKLNGLRPSTMVSESVVVDGRKRRKNGDLRRPSYHKNWGSR